MKTQLTRVVWLLIVWATATTCFSQTQSDEPAKPGIAVSTPIFVADSLADSVDQKLQSMGWTVPDNFAAQGVLAVDYYKFHFVFLVDTSQIQASGLFGEHAYEVPRIFLHQRRKFQDGKKVKPEERHLVSYLTYQLAAYLPELGRTDGLLGSPNVLWSLDADSFQRFQPEGRQIPFQSDGTTPYQGGKDHQAGRLGALNFLLSRNSSDPILLIQMSASPVSNNKATKNREPGQLGGLGESGLTFIDVYPTSLGNQKETYNIWVFAGKKPIGKEGRSIEVKPPVDVRGQAPEPRPDDEDSPATGGSQTGGATNGGKDSDSNPCTMNPSAPGCSQPFNWMPLFLGAVSLLVTAGVAILGVTAHNRRRDLIVGGLQFGLKGFQKKSMNFAGEDPIEADNILLLGNEFMGTLDAVTLGTFSIHPLSGKVGLSCAAGIAMNTTTDLNIQRLSLVPGQRETVHFVDHDSGESLGVDIEVAN